MKNLKVFTNKTGLQGLIDEDDNIIIEAIFEELVYNEELKIFNFKIKTGDEISIVDFDFFHKNKILKVNKYMGKYKEESIHLYYIIDFKLINEQQILDLWYK